MAIAYTPRGNLAKDALKRNLTILDHWQTPRLERRQILRLCSLVPCRQIKRPVRISARPCDSLSESQRATMLHFWIPIINR